MVLTVPGLSLTKDTALSVQAKTGFSSFLPQEAGLEALQEAPSHGIPVILYDARSRGAEAYVALAREFLARRASSAKA